MWNRALNPLPTKPIPSRSVVMSFAEKVRYQERELVRSQTKLAAIELGVTDAELLESGGGGAVPFVNEKGAPVLQVLDAHLACSETRGRQITETIVKRKDNFH